MITSKQEALTPEVKSLPELYNTISFPLCSSVIIIIIT